MGLIILCLGMIFLGQLELRYLFILPSITFCEEANNFIYQHIIQALPKKTHIIQAQDIQALPKKTHIIQAQDIMRLLHT